MKFTSPYVNKASNWLIFVKGPIRGFVYIRACEFQYELLNFTTKFGTKFATFAEKLYEINCKARLRFSPSDACERVDELRMFGVHVPSSEHS